MNVDALRFLIQFEGGATALLATALARPSAGDPLPYHLAIWDALSKQLGLPLSTAGPTETRIEDGNLDLVLLWDDWCIVFEVKVRSGSVREGQLQEYYDLLRSGPDVWASRYPTASQLCLVFVTPSKVGVREFESLAVAGLDRKRHLAWEDLLKAIGAALDSSNDPSRPIFFENLLRSGVVRISRLLQEFKSRATIEVTDAERLARRRFALDVQAAVIVRQPEWAPLFRPLWTAPSVEEAYLSLDLTRRANVYFTVFSESLIVPDEQGASTAQVRFWFKFAGKHRSAGRAAFLALDRPAILSELGLSPELAASVVFDDEKLSITLRTSMLGLRSELLARCALVLERLVGTFQKLFA
jgi:hypothetical protein